MAKVLSDPDRVTAGVSPKKFLEHFNEIRNAKFKQDQAVAITRIAKKRAKADGVNLEALAIMERMSNLPPENAKVILQQFGIYSTITKQEYADLPLFAASNVTANDQLLTKQALEDAEHAGRLVGAAGGNKNDNPYLFGSEFHARWHRGFDNGWEFYEKRPADEKKIQAASGRGRGRPPGAKNKAKGDAPIAGAGKAPTVTAPAAVQ